MGKDKATNTGREEGREGGECRERPTILDRIKWNNLSPSPTQSNDEGTKEQKRAILASLKWGRGGLDVPFILSNMVT